MNRLIIGVMTLTSLLTVYPAIGKQVVCNVDTYTFTMKVAVPRIYDNLQSQGSRKYNTQTIKGSMLICYTKDYEPIIIIQNLVNKSQRLSNGMSISYKCNTQLLETFPNRVYLIGNNKTGKFHTASVGFFLDAEPSYNKGTDDPDNSLLIVLSGKGITKKVSTGRRINKIIGRLAGTLGCGCMAYGHTSPTRVAGWRGNTNEVRDPASVYGTWNAKFKSSYVGRVDIDDDDY